MEGRARTALARLARARVWLSPGAATLALAVGAVLAGAGLGVAADVAWVGVAALGMALCLGAIVRSLRHGRLGVDLIAVLALAGAVGVRQYLASAVIGLMLATGQALEAWAAGRAQRELSALVARAPRTARRVVDGQVTLVALDVVAPGDLLLVGAGEVVPVDGRVEGGAATFDESALTGESLPVERGVGDAVRSGVVNAGAPVALRATTSAIDSTYATVVRLVAEAEGDQAPYVRLADRYALVFLVVTLAVAAVGAALGGASRAVAVLVVATPCPLILAAPIAQVAGLSRAARRGVIVKGGAVLERLAECRTLLLDKTGTVTMGRPALVRVVTTGHRTTDEVLALAASLDQVSPHVLASAVVRGALEHGCILATPHDVREVSGAGIAGLVDGRRVSVGTAAWCGVVGVPDWLRTLRRRARLDGDLAVFVGVDDAPAGVLVFRDPLRPDASRTIRSLRRGGISRIVMVTGDRGDVADTIGAVVGVDEVMAERSPEEKLDVVRVEERLAPTMMVGDGINDAPALALAHVGVALGARGATAASEAADVVLTVDRLDRLSEAAALARRTRRIAVESMVAGIALSLIAMGIAASGHLAIIAGAILQEAIDLAVILNALRALSSGPEEARLAQEDAALTRRFHDEHVLVRADLERMRAVAESMGDLPAREALVEIGRVHRLLVDEVLPHEQAEEEVLYPALGRFLGGRDPMGTMSRAHVEIAHQIRRLGHLLDDVDPAEPDDTDLAELRGLLYGLHAILQLHTAQEEESYLSLGDETPSAARS